MARETCIKTSTGTFCSSSPIRKCSCKDFDDPFSVVPDQIGSVDSLREDFNRVLAEWEGMRDTVGSGDKFRLIATVTRLVLLPEVKIVGPVIITSIDVPDRASAG